MNPPGTHVWHCPSCGRQVPLRIEECRCGTTRTVATSSEESLPSDLAEQPDRQPQTQTGGNGTRPLLVGLLLGLTLAAVGFSWWQFREPDAMAEAVGAQRESIAEPSDRKPPTEPPRLASQAGEG